MSIPFTKLFHDDTAIALETDGAKERDFLRPSGFRLEIRNVCSLSSHYLSRNQFRYKEKYHFKCSLMSTNVTPSFYKKEIPLESSAPLLS